MCVLCNLACSVNSFLECAPDGRRSMRRLSAIASVNFELYLNPARHHSPWALPLPHLTMKVDTLGIEPRASRMLSGCDTTTPRARDVAVKRSEDKGQCASGYIGSSHVRPRECAL